MIMDEQHFTYVGGPQKTRGPNAPLISSALWATQKSQIEYWYIQQRRELNDVISLLRAEDGFSLLSERQLTYRLQLWGCSKKNTTAVSTSTSNAQIDIAGASSPTSFAAPQLDIQSTQWESVTGFPDSKQTDLLAFIDIHKENPANLSAKKPIPTPGLQWLDYIEQSVGPAEDAISLYPTPEILMSDALPSDSALRDVKEQISSMESETCGSTLPTADDDADRQLSTRDARPGPCQREGASFDAHGQNYRTREPEVNMDAESSPLNTERIMIWKLYGRSYRIPRYTPTQVYNEPKQHDTPVSPSPGMKQLINEFQPGRDLKVWSVNRLFSSATRQPGRQLGPKDLAEVDLLADFFSATSLHEEAFYLSRLVVQHIMPVALEAGLDHLTAKLTRLVKNAIRSSDRMEATRIMNLAATKWGRIDPISLAARLLFSHTGYIWYVYQGPSEEAQAMCEKALSNISCGWGTWAALAELHANLNLLTRKVPDQYLVYFCDTLEEKLTSSIGGREQCQLNDSIKTICEWIYFMLTGQDSCEIFTNQAEALWGLPANRLAQVDIESSLLFCDLWNRWQHRKDTAGSASAACEEAFELLQVACGLGQIELMSAFARMIIKKADRGVKANLESRVSHQIHRIVAQPKLRSIFSLLGAHVEPKLGSWDPGYSALRRQSIRTFVENNMSISETLLYDSRFRQTAQTSETPFVSPFLTNSPRSSCSTDLRSFKGVQLRQLAKRMSKSSSRRWSQISELSTASFSSGKRWLQEHEVEPQNSLLQNSTSTMTMISAPKLISSSNVLVDLFDTKGVSDTDQEAADAMDLDVGTRIMS